VSSTASNARVDAIAAKAGAAFGCCVSAAVVRCHNFDVFYLPFPVRPLVLDPHVREVDMAIDHGKIPTCGPVRDGSDGGVGLALSSSAIAMEFAQKTLIVALQLVVQDDPPNARSAASQTFCGMKIGSIKLSVVRELSWLDDTGIELLSGRVRPRGSMPFEQLPATVGQGHERRLLASHNVRFRLDKPFFTEPSKLALS
jgi:hypothetical protein